jgi:hypothetical protein
MARYLSYRIDGNNSLVCKLHPSNESKSFWQNADQSLSFLQINEEQFTKFKYNYTYTLDNGNLTFVEIPVNDPPKSFDKNTIQLQLNKHIKAMEYFIQNNVNPYYTQNDVDYLKNINIEGLEYPILVPQQSWVAALESKLPIKIDTALEIN